MIYLILVVSIVACFADAIHKLDQRGIPHTGAWVEVVLGFVLIIVTVIIALTDDGES